MATSNTGPALIAYIAEDSNREGGKTRWHRVGAMWENRSGQGYTLVIPPGISVSGRVQLMPPKEDDRR